MNMNEMYSVTKVPALDGALHGCQPTTQEHVHTTNEDLVGGLPAGCKRRCCATPVYMQSAWRQASTPPLGCHSGAHLRSCMLQLPCLRCS
jgi:hypothetical protein